MRLYYKPKKKGDGPLVIEYGGTHVWPVPGEVHVMKKEIVRPMRDKDGDRQVTVQRNADGEIIGGPGVGRVWRKVEGEVGEPSSYKDVDEDFFRHVRSRSRLREVLLTEDEWLQDQGIEGIDRQIMWLEKKRDEMEGEKTEDEDIDKAKRPTLMKIGAALGLEGVHKMSVEDLRKNIKSAKA